MAVGEVCPEVCKVAEAQASAALLALAADVNAGGDVAVVLAAVERLARRVEAVLVRVMSRSLANGRAHEAMVATAPDLLVEARSMPVEQFGAVGASG